ncbi:PepSY-associated TM helix domain-containing protein [Flavobacterium sp. WC2429]|uniref:PepSY-associated TM helix domain-containing protein n=1 Tax=Flavobacterium sp. WC2429 TaxID=3234140 RepID=A0AB39WJ33_9FLAO
MNKTLKKSMGKIHLWLGLSSGLIVFIVALTGSILVFEDEIDLFINPEFYKVAEIGNNKKPIDHTIMVLQESQKVGKMLRIYTFDDPERTIQIMGKNSEGQTQFFSVDPYSGKVVGSAMQNSRFFSVVLDLHRHLLVEDIGKLITGCSCLLFAFVLISGFFLWWPKKIKNLKQRLTVKWDSSFKRVNWDFHSTFGFYSVLFLLVISLTGLTWSFEWFENGIYYLVDGTAKKAINKLENPIKKDRQLDKTAFYQSILNATDSVYPYRGNVQIRMPNDTMNSILVLKVHLEKNIPNQSSIAFFDKNTAKIIATKPYESFTKGDKIRRAIFPIHTGSIYGYPTKIIAFLVSLFAATSPITGLLIWLGRKKKNNLKIHKAS